MFLEKSFKIFLRERDFNRWILNNTIISPRFLPYLLLAYLFPWQFNQARFWIAWRWAKDPLCTYRGFHRIYLGRLRRKVYFSPSLFRKNSELIRGICPFCLYAVPVFSLYSFSLSPTFCLLFVSSTTPRFFLSVSDPTLDWFPSNWNVSERKKYMKWKARCRI